MSESAQALAEAYAKRRMANLKPSEQATWDSTSAKEGFMHGYRVRDLKHPDKDWALVARLSDEIVRLKVKMQRGHDDT